MGECRNRAERVSLEIPFYFRNYPQQFPEALDGNPLFLQAGYGQPMYIATSSAWWSKRAAKVTGGEESRSTYWSDDGMEKERASVSLSVYLHGAARAIISAGSGSALGCSPTWIELSLSLSASCVRARERPVHVYAHV